MKNFAFAFFIFIIPFPGMAQLSETRYSVGKYTDTGDPIYAEAYSSGKYIRSWHVTDNGRTVMATEGEMKGNGKFKKKGTVSCYDLEDGGALWSKGVNFKLQGVHFFDSLVMIEDNKAGIVKNYYEPRTGELLHGSSDDLLGILPDGGLLKWNLNAGRANISSVRRNGKVRWEIPLTEQSAVSEHYMLDDSTLVVVANGIYVIDITDGSVWHYPAKTSYVNREALRSARALRFNNYSVNYYAGNIVWSVYPVDPVVSGVYSNVLPEDGRLYWAGGDNLACLDEKTGTPLWEVPLDSGQSSSSTLFVDEGRLYHLNSGSVVQGQNNYRCGEPFIAVYDASNGDLISRTPTDRILSFLVDAENRRTYILTPGAVYPYLMEEDRLEEARVYAKLGTEFIPFFVRGDAMIADTEGQGFRFVEQVYPSDSFLLGLWGVKCWVVSGLSMEVIEETEWNRITVPVKMTGSHIISSDAFTTRFLDVAQQSRADVKAGFDSRYHGNYLFWSKGRYIFRVDLSGFIPEAGGDGNIADYGTDIQVGTGIY